MFPTIEETKMILQNNASSFFSSMTEYDLEARGAKSILEYRDKYMDSIKNFNEDEKIIIKDNVKYIDTICKRFKKYNSIPWKFAKLCCKVENGYPHTLVDIIFLPSDFFLRPIPDQRETIIHEKIHIYQRLYSVESNILVSSFWKYNIHGFQKDFPKIRNNPDLNHIIYSRGRLVCTQQYKENPTSLSDSVKTCDYEHPFEKMAYIIADIIHNNKIQNDDYISAMKWMQLYL